jgi:NAD(P)-dependent dehydrogenase (short-subunit alcohol dehydrogenase family)
MQTVDLKELRIAVTGGTSGLGLALVRHLVARGARVVFIARTAQNVEQIANETGACGIVGDVGRKQDSYPVALQVLGNLGGLDALINNASALDQRRFRFLPIRNVKNLSKHCR